MSRNVRDKRNRSRRKREKRRLKIVILRNYRRMAKGRLFKKRELELSKRTRAEIVKRKKT